MRKIIEKEKMRVTNSLLLIVCMSVTHGVRCRGGRGAAAPPQILEENFSIHSAPPDFGGFCSEMFELYNTVFRAERM